MRMLLFENVNNIENMIIIRNSEHAAFVGGDHVLYVDVCIFSSMLFQNLKSLLDKIRQILALLLSVVNLISNIHSIISYLRLLFLNMLKTGNICL